MGTVSVSKATRLLPATAENTKLLKTPTYQPPIFFFFFFFFFFLEWQAESNHHTNMKNIKIELDRPASPP